RNHRPASRLQKPDEQRLCHCTSFPAVSTWIAGFSQRGLSPNDVPVSSDRDRKPPACAEGSSCVRQGSAYRLTWILLPARPPRPPAPGRAPPPLETSFTQSAPSPR